MLMAFSHYAVLKESIDDFVSLHLEIASLKFSAELSGWKSRIWSTDKVTFKRHKLEILIQAILPLYSYIRSISCLVVCNGKY